ncbi:RNA-directed DNA polymerase [Pseudomonas aeruginosa]|nr:RNA-directed DNA polymerase [Pseudomonas aeruginosa]EKT7962901.1 RNA-directed DNA polymerase [Pseudomonas aeruginosa]
MAMDKPYYPYRPISSIDALARTLGVVPKLLCDLADDPATSYVKFTIFSKNGKQRDVYEPKYELKRLQKRINSRIFELVIFPSYLQGGIKDVEFPRDYIENSKLHAGSGALVSVDIKDFYNSIREPSVLSIFKNFFSFPDDVSCLLTRLVMLEGRVPQGACTSSYVANLIFHNSEYSLVSKFRAKGLAYSRLLDDVTVSATKPISQEESTLAIKSIAAMARKHDLRLNSKKTKIERSDDINADYAVTGVWVGHGVPKLRKDERRHIRHLVYICEKEYAKDCFSVEYHSLWNRVSGQVSKLTRLKHAQAKSLRERMGNILPKYDFQAKAKIIYECSRLLRRPVSSHKKIGVINNYRRLIYSIGILSRTDRSTAKALRRQLVERFAGVPSKAEMWS